MFDKIAQIANNATTTVAATGPQLPSSKDLKRVLYMSQVYDPDRVSDADAYKYVVPLETEMVIDDLSGTYLFYECTHVDYEGKTLKPTFKLISNSSGENTPDYDYDKELFNINSGYQGEGIVSVNYSARPNVAVIDKQIMCPDAAYALLYKGSTLTSDNIISAVYSSLGNLTTDHIPVRLAAVDGLDNKSIMTTDKFSVRLNAEELPEGTRCTVLFFDSAGELISRPRILNVQHTAALQDHQVGRKYIKSVELVAPWFTDSGQPNVLNIPVNTMIRTIAFSAIVYYSDGSTENVFIDGKKVRLIGLDMHAPTAPQQKSWLTLVYNFDSDEQAYEAQAGVQNKYSKDYQIVAKPLDGSYSPKLYTVPSWNGTGYDLRHFLTDLDRKFAIEVTKYVYPNESSDTFKPTSYGTEQSLEFNLRLSDASPNFKSLIMRQPVTVILNKAGTESGSRWGVRYSYLGITYNDPAFVALRYLEGSRIDASAGCETQEEWLSKLYYNLEPAYITSREKKPPVPTHFEIIDSKYQVWRFPITEWNKQLIIDKNVVDETTLIVRWMKIDEDGTTNMLAVGGASILTTTAGLETTIDNESDISNRAQTTMIDYLEVTP